MTPDAYVRITLIATVDGGRRRPYPNNARPQYKLVVDGKPYQTSTSHTFIDADGVWPGGSAFAHVAFITPEAYPHSMAPGDVFDVCEGARVTGHSEILDVYNSLLLRRPRDNTSAARPNKVVTQEAK